ncbi:hypothetical protein [Pseudonocardia sp. ICBG601]|uniref:hypothetical protein n=1 Tax=Pseudonocardia sp. ICBG601 TaxID=2846759 RepID=UPI001CF6F019|nr:hypothetical protein [Pseudonocardia sp. ICBG601]
MTDPLVSARLWLEASRTISYTDPGPLTWTERVAPLVTGAVAQANAALTHDDASGAGWGQLIQGRCAVKVSDIDAIIPREAPRTDQQVYIQVVGTVRTSCHAAGAPPIPPERVAATVAVQHGTDGAWRVTEQLF